MRKSTFLIIAIVLLMASCTSEEQPDPLEFRIIVLEQQIKELTHTVDLQEGLIFNIIDTEVLMDSLVLEKLNEFACNHIKLQQQLLRHIKQSITNN